jgi:enoyl-CoA hydratase/carnithine racemase
MSMSDIWGRLKEWPELILERLDDSGVARIVLNRPDKRNCWNRALCLAFLEALEIIRADKALKVVITKGAGTVYSSGLDLNVLREVSNGPLLDWDRPNLTIRIAEPCASSRASSSPRCMAIAWAARSAS